MEDGLDCSVAILKYVWIVHLPPIAVWNLRFQKQHAASFIRQQGLSMPDALLGRIMGSSPEVRSETTPDP